MKQITQDQIDYLIALLNLSNSNIQNSEVVKAYHILQNLVAVETKKENLKK